VKLPKSKSRNRPSATESKMNTVAADARLKKRVTNKTL
jgi:hypothetical protein